METVVKLVLLQVPKDEQNQGQATEFIQSLCNFADYYDTELILQSPDNLTKFYSKFGFTVISVEKDVEYGFHMSRKANKGRVTE